VGRPRPDLFGRCNLPEDLTSNPVHGLTSWEACQRTDLLKDGFRSFPSGHSSFAWAGMWYFILYLCASESLFGLCTVGIIRSQGEVMACTRVMLNGQRDTGGLSRIRRADAAEMRINNKRGYTVKAWILLAPLMCAILVGVSRSMDYRHHATDIIAGGIIGILGAWFAYRQYYPVCLFLTHHEARAGSLGRCKSPSLDLLQRLVQRYSLMLRLPGDDS
jgi:diacylglycerol diphosphate phosphatase/phosphatidate phosphatase